MNATHSTAERAGRWLGHAYRAVVRAEMRCAGWLIRKGMSRRVVSAATWIVRLLLVATLVQLSLVVACLLAAAFIATKALGHPEPFPDKDPSEWRNGPLGFGLYDRDGSLIYSHDLDDHL